MKVQRHIADVIAVADVSGKNWDEAVSNLLVAHHESYFERHDGPCLNAADLRGSDLSSVDLNQADLSHANLSKVHLDRASLVAADLRGADLRGACLIEADLRQARLEGAIFDRTTQLPFTEFEAISKGMVFESSDSE